MGKAMRGGGQAEGRDEIQIPIWFGSYNIHNDHNGGLESSLRGVAQTNLDMGVLQ